MATNKPLSNSHSFTFVHLGRNGGLITLATSSIADKHAWMDSIQIQRSALIDSSKLFDLQILSDDQFKISSRVNCSVTYSGMLVIGTDDGLYVGLESCDGCQLHRPTFRKVLDKERIVQVDILPDYDMLIILSGNYTLKHIILRSNSSLIFFGCIDYD